MFDRYMWLYTVNLLKPLVGKDSRQRVYEFDWRFLERIPMHQAAPAMDDDEAFALVAASARAHQVYNAYQQRQSSRRATPPRTDQVQSELDSFGM